MRLDAPGAGVTDTGCRRVIAGAVLRGRLHGIAWRVYAGEVPEEVAAFIAAVDLTSRDVSLLAIAERLGEAAEHADGRRGAETLDAITAIAAAASGSSRDEAVPAERGELSARGAGGGTRASSPPEGGDTC